MSTKLEDYLDIEKLLSVKLKREMAKTVSTAWATHSKFLAAKDFDKATEHAEAFTLEGIIPNIEAYAKAIMRSAIDYGASMAAGGGRTLTSSLALDRTVTHNVRLLTQYLRYSGTLFLQKKLLQSIAQARLVEVEQVPLQKSSDSLGALEVPVYKASAVKDFQSFQDDADSMAQMSSSLHTSRLSGWGFTAEADMLGITTYKLSAQLDNRTSKFCRFIHGKTFSIASAKKILDSAVYADDPNDLKTLHPWPNQTIQGMETYSAMSSKQLQDIGMGVPPFHPGCRTLMVRVDYKTRLSKPKVPRTTETLPDYTSTPETFYNLGIKMSKEKVSIWNDYMNVDPVVMLSTLTKKPIPELLGNSKGMLRISAAGDIVFAWGVARSLSVLFRTGSGALELSSDLANTMLRTGEWDTLKSLYSSFGASTAVATVQRGEAIALSEAGFIPDVGGWPALQATIASNLSSLGAGSLTASQEESLKSLLVSTNPNTLKQIHTLGLSKKVMQHLFEGVAYRGTFSFDETGLS